MSAPGEEGLLRWIHGRLRAPVRPRDRSWVSFAVVMGTLLFLQGASGVLLSVYYLPSPESASDSVRFIMREVEWGWLVRGLHGWGTAAILAVLALQLFRSLLLGTYRGARAGSWVLGVLLLLLVLGLGFTGELLVWDERAVGLATAALRGTELLPLVGPPLAGLLRGGSEVGVATLARAHAAHVLILPWLAFLLLLLDVGFRASASRRASLSTRPRAPAHAGAPGGEA